MESSIAVFLPRQLACEQLPTSKMWGEEEEAMGSLGATTSSKPFLHSPPSQLNQKRFGWISFLGMSPGQATFPLERCQD